MEIEVPEEQIKRAKTPHELFMLNLIAFHLLLTPAVIVLAKFPQVMALAKMLGIGELALVLPLPPLFSSLVILYTYVRSRADQPWFVMAHWKLALRRYRILGIGYGLSALVMLGGWALTQGSSMEGIMIVALTRVGIMPTLIAVIIDFALEAGSINQAERGEVPDAIASRYPPPASVGAG